MSFHKLNQRLFAKNKKDRKTMEWNIAGTSLLRKEININWIKVELFVIYKEKDNERLS
jgi:hypothetical protein